MARPDRVLISAFVGSDNLGDEAIFLSLAEQLASKLGGRWLTAASVNPRKTKSLLRSRNHPEASDIRVRPRTRLPLDIVRHDVCIFGGGGIIQDQSSILNLLYFLLQICLARSFGKRVVLAFVGVGPLRSRLGRIWVRAALSGISMCIVRDEESKALLDTLGVTGTDIRCAADIALNLECNPAVGPAFKVEAPYVLVCLRHWYGQRRFLTPASMKSGRVKAGTKLDELLDGLVHQLSILLDRDKDLRILAVPFFGHRDALVQEALFDRFPPEYKPRLASLDVITDPCEYMRLAGSARLVLGMRLHALVLASLAAVPVVALRYSAKISAFMKQLALDDRVIDIELMPEVGALAGCVEAALEDRYDREKQVRSQVRSLRRSNEEGLAEICRLIRRA